MPQPEKENAKNVDAFSTVTIPPAHSVEIENPTRKPKDGICNWCRAKPGDIFCEGWPMCFDCIEIVIERDNARAILDENNLGGLMRNERYFDAWTPWGWEKVKQ